MALYTKNVNLIMTDDYEIKEKFNIRVAIIVVAILVILLTCFVNVEFNGKIYIREITVEQLEDIPTIGFDKATLIHDYIQLNGFTDYEDLLSIDGIGEATIKKLKKHTRR